MRTDKLQELFNQSKEVQIMPLVICGLRDGDTHTNIHIHMTVISRNQAHVQPACAWFKSLNRCFYNYMQTKYIIVKPSHNYSILYDLIHNLHGHCGLQ